MKRFAYRVFAAALLPASAIAAAAGAGPAGYWTTIDDKTQQPRSIVAIGERDGMLSGRIVRLYRQPGEDPDPRCEACSGARHDAPVIGMEILWNLRRNGDAWSGGEILDPESGETYRVTLRTADAGTHLEVRGFIGIALLGRTQVWTRTSAP